MHTIFINNIPIYLTDDLKQKSETNFYNIEEVDLSTLIQDLELGLLEKVYLYDASIENLWNFFSSQFKIIKAAGGKVYNLDNEILFIYRNNKWDLPKGKIEKNEIPEQAAMREVEEETGVKYLKIKQSLETTFHIYKFKEKQVLKISYWYKMETSFKGKLKPQKEEGISRVNWLNDKQIKNALNNTYDNIKLLFQ